MKEFRRIYPNTGRITLDGGKNNKFERSIIEDNETPDALNVVFTNGAVETRQGKQKLNTQAIGSFAIDGLYTRRDRSNNQTMVAFAGGTMWVASATSFNSIPSSTSQFTAGVRVATTQYENHMFIGNGGIIPYKYNGTDFTRHGVYPPTTTSTVASQAVGVLTGDYRYKVTYVNSQSVESDVGPVSTTFSAAGATLRVSAIPAAPQSFGVAARNLYRNSTAASGSYFRVTTLNDNTTTQYDDNNADSALGSAAPTSHGVPPNYSAIIYHQNRLFMNDPTNPSLVFWTDLGEPYTVNTTANFQQVGDDSTDLVKGFAIYDNSLVVFCERSITIGYMQDTTPGNWRWVSSKAPYGSKSPFALPNVDNKILFPAMDDGKFVGFAAFSGDTLEPDKTLLTVSSVGSDMKSNRIEPDVFAMLDSKVDQMSAITYKNKAYIAVAYGSSATENNRIYVYDFSLGNLQKSQRASWVPWDNLSASQFTIFNGNLYFGSSTANGFVYQLETGTYNDDGVAINSYYWTKEYAGFKNENNFFKDFRFINILVDQAGDYYMDLAYRPDSDNGSGTNQAIYLNPGGSLWGTMMWGRDLWGGGSAQDDKHVPLGGARGSRIQFKFSNQNKINQRFKVHSISYTYNLKGLR